MCEGTGDLNRYPQRRNPAFERKPVLTGRWELSEREEERALKSPEPRRLQGEQKLAESSESFTIPRTLSAARRAEARRVQQMGVGQLVTGA